MGPKLDEWSALLDITTLYSSNPERSSKMAFPLLGGVTILAF